MVTHLSVRLSVCFVACLSEVAAAFSFYCIIQVNMRSILRALSGITTVRFHKAVFLHSLKGVTTINLYTCPHVQYVLYVCIYVCV